MPAGERVASSSRGIPCSTEQNRPTCGNRRGIPAAPMADPGYLAIWIYRSVGFADQEIQTALERPPAASAEAPPE